MTSNPLTLLIDADLIVYRAGFSSEYVLHVALSEEGEPLEEAKGKRGLKGLQETYPEAGIASSHIVEPVANAIHTVNHMIESMLTATGVSDYRLFLTGKDNFRNEVYPIYKANRIDSPRPTHYAAIRNHMVTQWNGEVIQGMEADDALGIHQTSSTIIASTDKDLDCISGVHYNFVKDLLYTVSEQEATNFFYMQMLAGDGTDNICALRGVGLPTAKKRLDKYPDYHTGAIEEYKKYYGEGWEEAWDCNEQLIGIRYEDN